MTKSKMKAALVVLALALGAAGTAQAKEVVLKEVPSEFRGMWGGSGSAPFGIYKHHISMDGADIEIKKVTMDTKNPKKITVVSRFMPEPCGIEIPRSAAECNEPLKTSVYTLKNKTLTETSKGKVWGPYRQVAGYHPEE